VSRFDLNVELALYHQTNVVLRQQMESLFAVVGVDITQADSGVIEPT
jgi:hypothetical protein